MGDVLMVAFCVLVILAIAQAVRLAIKGDRTPITYVLAGIGLCLLTYYLLQSTA